MGRHVLVYTDHQSLTTLPTQKVLSYRVYHWLEYLENFNYEIKYLYRENNQVTDALSRLKDASLLYPEESISLCNFRSKIFHQPNQRCPPSRLFYPDYSFSLKAQ